VATAYDGGSGTSTSPYEIATGSQLAYLASQVNSGVDTSSKYYKLTANIYLNSNGSTTNIWTPIGSKNFPFKGIFDGQGYTVYNLYINTSTETHQGLFGSIDSGAIVQNVGVTGSITAYRYEGGITGYNDGTIQYCFNEASVTGNDSGTRGAGGIAGVNGGTILSCYNKGTIYNSYRPAGGIAGIFDADKSGGMYITNCYNVGSVSSASGSGWAGAIVATRNNGTISDCYYLNTSAGSGVAYGSTSGTTSKTDAEMKASSFVVTLGSSVWKTVSNDYPTLKVNQNSVTITMTSNPTKTTYNAGEYFSTAGMVIMTDSNIQITDYNVSNTNPLTVNDTSVIISGTYNGTTAYSFTIPITVNATMTGSVYLNGTATTNGTGTSTWPFNSLTDAINAATYNALDITVTGTVSLTSSATINDEVTFVRGYGMSGSMFNVNLANSNDILTLTSMTIDGNGSGTLLNVTSGTLRLRGNAKLQNCATAVYVNGGALTVNKATVTGSTNSIYLNAGTLTIDDFGNTSITGQLFINASTTFNYAGSGIASGQIVYLNNTSGNSDAYITLTAVPTTTVTVQSANPFDGERVASSADSESAADQFAVNNSGFEIDYVLGYVTLAAIS
jgi:hypothetical protein